MAEMSPLRRRITEDMTIRNLSPAHGELILSLVEDKPDITLGELQARLGLR